MHNFQSNNDNWRRKAHTNFPEVGVSINHGHIPRANSLEAAQALVIPLLLKTALTNKILSALPEEDFARLLPNLEPVSFSSREDIREMEGGNWVVYFPQTVVASQLSVLNDGSTAEVAIIGNEGMIGLSVIFNSHVPEQWAKVLFAGSALRIRAEALKQEFDRGEALQKLLLDYAGNYVEQVSQRAVCNSQHKIEERLASWLLMTHDRAGSDLLPLTQEQIARRLGTRRSSITLAAAALQERQIISYLRGRIHILNRHNLEQAACECYDVVSQQERPEWR